MHGFRRGGVVLLSVDMPCIAEHWSAGHSERRKTGAEGVDGKVPIIGRLLTGGLPYFDILHTRRRFDPAFVRSGPHVGRYIKQIIGQFSLRRKFSKCYATSALVIVGRSAR